MKNWVVIMLCMLDMGAIAQSVKYMAIPGTKVQLAGPVGFKVAETFIGLQKDRNTGIQIYEYTDRPYSQLADDFTLEGLKAKGAEVYEFKELKTDGYNAKFACLPGDTGFMVSTLMFGDSSFSVMMVAAYPAHDVVLQKQVNQSLLSAKYNKAARLDPFALSYFKLNDTDSKYKYVKSTGDNMYIYAPNGEQKESYMAEPAITAMPIMMDSNTVETVGNALLEDMKKYGLNEAQVTYKSLKKINGFDAYEAIIYGEVAKEKHAVYHMVVAKGNRGFIVQGIAQRDYEINMQEFEKLAHTVSTK